MEPYPIRQNLPDPKTRIRFHRVSARQRFFAAFLICAALLIAAFATSAVWLGRGGGEWLKNRGFFPDDRNGQETESNAFTESGTAGGETESAVPSPEAELPNPEWLAIVEKDLSCRVLGENYIHNTTVYAPDVPTLLQRNCGSPEAAERREVTVLILHTHTSEAYSPKNATHLEGIPGDVTYDRDSAKNVLAVGETLCRTLNESGIPAVHCRAVHDDPTLSGAYDRAAESIRFYLEQYPSIRYVIDLHRDSVTDADGNYIRAVAQTDSGMSAAQVMPVVGTDGNGSAHPNWERNLALALQLRELLNAEGGSLCRPVCLRNSSYNQELAPYSLLLEIGTGANSVEEAERSAEIVGQVLATLIRGASSAPAS